jgi:hypothetical protein
MILLGGDGDSWSSGHGLVIGNHVIESFLDLT